jgi:hypothetical protein
MWYCFSKCARGGDAYSLEIALKGGSFATAYQRVGKIIGRPVQGDFIYRPARFTENILADAAHFQTGLRWQTERTLNAIKSKPKDSLETNATEIRRLTFLLNSVEKWTPIQAAEMMVQLQASHAELVQNCIEESRESMRTLAAVFVKGLLSMESA